MILDTDRLFDSESEWGSFHDVCWETIEHREYTVDELKGLFARLPRPIQMTAIEWGLSDTVFRDLAYLWFKENKDKMLAEKE